MATIYHLKRRLRTPIIELGRRRNRAKGPAELAVLEYCLYRRRSLRAYGQAVFDPHHLYRADLDDGSVVVDIGGYTGEVAQTILDLYGCRIEVFEPHPAYAAQATDRFSDEPRVSVHPYGLGSRDLKLPLEVRGPGSSVHGTPLNATDSTSTQTVDVQIRDVNRTLEHLDLKRLDLVKINIEGAEYDLLDRFLDQGWQHRTRYLLIQFHEGFSGAEINRWKIRRRLRKTHYQVWNYPWVYELWCSRAEPEAPRPSFSLRERIEVSRYTKAHGVAATIERFPGLVSRLQDHGKATSNPR